MKQPISGCSYVISGDFVKRRRVLHRLTVVQGGKKTFKNYKYIINTTTQQHWFLLTESKSFVLLSRGAVVRHVGL